MTIERLRSIVAIGCGSVCGASMVVGAWLGGPVLAGALVGSGILLGRSRSLMRALIERRLRARIEQGDRAGVERLVEELAQVQRGRERLPWWFPRPQLKIQARAALAAINRDYVEASHWLQVLEPTVSPGALADARYAVGVALLSAGCPAEAAPLLERVSKEPSCGARARAAAEFHLGEALSQVGRAQDAQAHYRGVIAQHPSGPLAQQARHRIDHPPPPYR